MIKGDRNLGMVKFVQQWGQGMILSLVLSRSSLKPYNLRPNPAQPLHPAAEQRKGQAARETDTGSCSYT
jgi:hypothetical protein